MESKIFHIQVWLRVNGQLLLHCIWFCIQSKKRPNNLILGATPFEALQCGHTHTVTGVIFASLGWAEPTFKFRIEPDVRNSRLNTNPSLLNGDVNDIWIDRVTRTCVRIQKRGGSFVPWHVSTGTKPNPCFLNLCVPPFFIFYFLFLFYYYYFFFFFFFFLVKKQKIYFFQFFFFKKN